MKRWKILLADDDPEDKEIIRDAMEMINAGNTINFEDDGEHALQLLSGEYDLGNIPCLIVLDLNMPKMNGTETLRRLKLDDRFREVPVIIFSTSINSIEMEKCMQLGAHSYITKPITFNECLETAQAFHKFWEA